MNNNLNPQQFTLQYARRTQPAGQHGATYGQDVEPHGRYLSERDPHGNYPKDLYETGEVTFKNPLHMPFGGGYSEPTNWKHQLSGRFEGATGRELSDKVVAAGHDGIITHDKYGTSEIVDLTGLKPRNREHKKR